MNKNEIFKNIDWEFNHTDFRFNFTDCTFLEQPDIGRAFDFEERTYIIQKYVENKDKINERDYKIALGAYYQDFKDEHYNEIIDKFGDELGPEGEIFQDMVWMNIMREYIIEYVEIEKKESHEAAENFKHYQIMKNYKQFI